MTFVDAPKLTKRPPPLWLVESGDTVWGPLPTYALLHGLTHGKLTESCRVRQIHASSWRSVAQVREVASMRRRLAHTLASAETVPEQKRSLLVDLVQAESASEVLFYALAAAATVTHAAAGAASRVREAWQPPSTMSVFGEGMSGTLGMPLPPDDLALGAARAGRAFRGAPTTSAVHAATAARLSQGVPEIAGVMMVPIGRGAQLLGMLELARTEHGFRHTDLQVLLRVAKVAARRLHQLSS